MRSILPYILLTAAQIQPGTAQAVPEAIPTAEQMRIYLTKRPEQDAIHWKDPARGGALQVRIMEVTDKGVSLHKTLASGLVARTVPLADLAGVSFTLAPVEQRLLRNPVAAAVPALRVLWKARSVTLGMESSNVADVGIALAKALRMSNEATAFDEAAALLDIILGKEPSDHRKGVVKEEHQTLEMARALLVGPQEETDRVAWKTTELDDNPEAMLMATAWLSGRHFADLQRLEEEHPRWEDDDEIRPLRLRLYNLSLDFALYPSLFQGARVVEASNGLKKAWEVHQYTHSTQLALHALEDLASLYPDSQAAKDTAVELARIKAREAAGKLEEQEMPEEGAASEETEVGTEEDASGLPKIPTQPKRYNLFDD
jgi:hypothetical protein